MEDPIRFRALGTKVSFIMNLREYDSLSPVSPHQRCQFQGCAESAQSSTSFCVAHGGGRRCQFQGCTKSARSSTSFCVAHGGGRRCQFQGCTKSAQSSTSFCVAHGGGKRCAYSGCVTSALIKEYCCKHATVMGVRPFSAQSNKRQGKKRSKGKQYD